MAKTKKKSSVGKHLFTEDKRKLKTLVTGESFDLFIMSIILADAIVLGLMTSEWVSFRFDTGLFLLDRLFMGIFIVEMLMKIYAEGRNFFKNGWNIFDFVIVAVSSVPLASAFIILRTFRLFRLLKYINRFSHLKDIVNTFTALLPNFVAMILVFAVFFYVFAIMAVSLYGDVFREFSTLGAALFTLLQTFTLDGWAGNIARPVMDIFPNAWVFFVSFILISFLIVISFLMSAVVQAVKISAVKK